MNAIDSQSAALHQQLQDLKVVYEQMLSNEKEFDSVKALHLKIRALEKKLFKHLPNTADLSNKPQD